MIEDHSRRYSCGIGRGVIAYRLADRDSTAKRRFSQAIAPHQADFELGIVVVGFIVGLVAVLMRYGIPIRRRRQLH